jgi:hypothetical protein
MDQFYFTDYKIVLRKCMFLVFSDVGRGEDRMIDWSSEIKNLSFL